MRGNGAWVTGKVPAPAPTLPAVTASSRASAGGTSRINRRNCLPIVSASRVSGSSWCDAARGAPAIGGERWRTGRDTADAGSRPRTVGSLLELGEEGGQTEPEPFDRLHGCSMARCRSAAACSLAAASSAVLIGWTRRSMPSAAGDPPSTR
jgi:hypothetical protein